MAYIDELKEGDRFTVKHHKDCEYIVTGFWDGAGQRWVDVKETTGKPLASTSFSETNVRSFFERKQIKVR